MKELLLAIQFQTIIPIRVRGDITEKDVARSSVFFPVAGMVQGICAALAILFLSPFFSPEITGGLVLLVLVLTNGGFHLDGLADTFDAIAVKSSGNPASDRAKRLLVMKDSSTGAIGVVAIAMGLLVKYLFLSSLSGKFGVIGAAYILLLMPAFSKWVSVPLFFHGNSARRDGLGRIFIEETRFGHLVLSTIVLVAIFVGATWVFPFTGIVKAGEFLLLAGAILYAFDLIWMGFCRRRFGGMTGDTFGASSEIADLLFIMLSYLWF